MGPPCLSRVVSHSQFKTKRAYLVHTLWGKQVTAPSVPFNYRSSVTVSCRDMKAKFLTIHTQWANSIAPWHDSHSEQRRASLDPLLAPIATAFGPSESRALSRFARLRVGPDRGPRAAGGLPPLLGHPVVVLRAHLVSDESGRCCEGVYAYPSCASGLCLMESRLLSAVLRPHCPLPTLNLPAQDKRDDRYQYHHPPHCEPGAS
jgi:hypothetical protein